MAEGQIIVFDSDRHNELENASRSGSLTAVRVPQFNGHLQNSSVEECHMPNIYEVRRFKKVRTVWATVASLAVEAILVAVVILLRWYCPGKKCGISAPSIAIYLNSAVWLLTLLVHRYVRYQRDHLRRYGYAEFYHKTRTMSAVPAYVFSTVTVILLVFVTILRDVNCDGLPNNCNLGLDAFGWIQILISLEVLLALPNHFVYLVRSLQFNMLRRTPDIFHESPLDQDNQSVRRDVGFRSQTLIEELLEKQSDAISYLKLRCEDLTRTIYNLTSQKSSVGSVEDIHTSDTHQLLQ